MNNPAPEYTKTQAKLYADQGLYDKAMEIYRHLINEFPDQKDLLDDFSDLQVKMQRAKASKEPELAILFKQWLDLLAQYRQNNEIQMPVHKSTT